MTPILPPPPLMNFTKDIKDGIVKEPMGITPFGIMNQKKYIIGTSFSKDGTAENRANFDYGTFWGGVGGGVADTFRDAGGKYWTFTDDKSKVVFLSDQAGPIKGRSIPGSEPERAKIPFTVHYKKPELLDEKLWSEYEQEIYITPDPNWLYDTFAQGVFNVGRDEIKTQFGAMTNDEILAMTNATIKDHGVQGSNFTLQEAVNFYIEKVIETKSEQIVMLLQDWWKSKMGIGIQGDALKNSCASLLTFAELSSNDPSISNQFGANEICAPWVNRHQQYIDHVVDSFQPVQENQNELLQMNLGIKTPFFSVSSEYNFHIPAYESLIESRAIPEALLPNMYVFVASFASKNVTDEHPDFLRYERIITLDGIVKEFSYDALKINEDDILENNNLKKAPAASKQYFDYWTSNLNNEVKKFPNKIKVLNQSVGKNQKMIFYPMQDVDILQNYNDQKFMFPMYNELEFSTGVTNIVGDTLRQTALSNHFMRYYAVNNNQDFSGLILPSAKGTGKNVMASSMAFVEVGETTNIANISGTKKFISETNIEVDKNIDTTSMTAFLASVDFSNLMEENTNDVSNFGLTKEQITYVRNVFNNPDIKNLFSESSIFVAKDENEEFLLSNPSNEMQRVMLSLILYGKMRKIESGKHRSFAAMMNGKSNYSETVMYVVNKRRLDPSGNGANAALQQYFFLNSSEIDVLKFIDTQVSYGVQYQYDVDAIVLSFGMNYEYKNSEILSEINLSIPDHTSYQDVLDYTFKVNTDDPEPQPAVDLDKKFGEDKFDTVTGQAKNEFKEFVESEQRINRGGDPALTFDIFDSQKAYDNIFEKSNINPSIASIGGNFMTARVKVRYRPDYRLLRVPFGSSTARVLDKPPIFPDALITPYKGTNNKILINLNQNVGEYFMKPIIINEEEKEQYLNQTDSQKIKITGFDSEPAIEYKSDDALGNGGYFEVYRVDKKPSTYSDFADNLLTTIDGLHEAAVGHVKTDSASLADDIKPNRKYYYMFRVVDAHGHVSNPSPIFEVEVVDDGGTVYMLQKIVELEEPDIKEVNKNFKKYLQIKPVSIQRLMNVPKSTSPVPSAFDYGEFGTEGDIKLGNASTAIWGKKFKIRITSKSSGKQVDLNVTFSKTEDSAIVNSAEGTISSKFRP
tara:strand:+ start:3301 stop:6723 length:3423 start_codon:yes stop_codon:yes gene_type:complete